ncbi:hypothetical protein RIF29_27773 [Crotalaria pallida]|uniref:Uncharacterized protein n=1 Tax=Crotalaria pallida TaxID=3830 RepID=A0AAN9I2N7_CROPI
MDEGNYAKGLPYCGFLKTPFSLLHATKTSGRVAKTSSSEAKINNEQDLEIGVKSFGEESVESELMRLHNLAGPPRFLFTIQEETKEDLEAEDENSRNRKGPSLSELMLSIDTTPLDPLDSYKHQGFNPLFETSLAESEFNMFRSSSPPPKFKFMRDAEEKLYRRLIEENRRKALKNHVVEDSPLNAKAATDKRVETFIRIIENKEGKELQQYLPHFPSSSSSQVHPLESSPTSF